MLVDVDTRDLSTTLLGRELPAPVLCAPVGVQSIVHEQAELPAARAAAGLGLPFVSSTVSSVTLEQIAEASGDGPRWFRLYWPSDPDVATSLVQRAGYDAILVTLDTKMLAWRPRDLQTAILRWAGMFNHRSATWDDLAVLRGATDLPVLLKGILHPDDARRAVDDGLDPSWWGAPTCGGWRWRERQGSPTCCARCSPRWT